MLILHRNQFLKKQLLKLFQLKILFLRTLLRVLLPKKLPLLKKLLPSKLLLRRLPPRKPHLKKLLLRRPLLRKLMTRWKLMKGRVRLPL